MSIAQTETGCAPGLDTLAATTIDAQDAAHSRVENLHDLFLHKAGTLCAIAFG